MRQENKERAQEAEFERTMAQFRQSASRWSEEEYQKRFSGRPALQVLKPGPRNRPVMGWVMVAAACLMAAVAIPMKTGLLYQQNHTQQDNGSELAADVAPQTQTRDLSTVSDEELLESVDQALSRSAPASMAPLEVLVSSSAASTLNNESSTTIQSDKSTQDNERVKQ